MLTLTESAVKQLRQLLSERSTDSNVGLRLDVEKGGCAGFQYVMKVGEPKTGDHVVQQQDVQVFVGSEGIHLLQGCQLDYVDALNDSGFRVDNPNAERSCGCGTSFEPRKTL